MKKNKLNASKKIVNNIEFDSKFEAQVYECLIELEKEKIISNLELQVPILLVPGFGYGTQSIRETKMIVDFKFIYDGKREVYFESKGWETPVFKIKLKLLKYLKKELRKEGLFAYILYKGRVTKDNNKQKEIIKEKLIYEFSKKYIRS